MLKRLDTFLKSIKLSKQVNILLTLVFLLGITLSGVALGIILNNHAQRQISSEAGVLLKTINSVRGYTDTQITPELYDQLESEFLPQVVPSYAAKEVFEMVRAEETWQNYFYKEATLNPTNLRDKADSFETEIVERFRQNPNLKEVTGFQTTLGGELFYIAHPIIVTKASCLQCHSTPDVAPKTMIERFGTENGFDWPLNQILGAQMLYVPASVVFQGVRQAFVVVMGIVIVVLAVSIFLVNRWLNRYIVRPLNRITQVAEAVSTGDLEAEFEQKSNDEVGMLAQAFTRMKTSLILAMQRLERYRQGQGGQG